MNSGVQYMGGMNNYDGGVKALRLITNQNIETNEVYTFYRITKEGERLVVEEIAFNKNFLKNFHRESFDMGIELFNEYPQFGNINGNIIPLRGVSKKFNTLEDMYRYYGKVINWNPETHAEIIDVLKWAKENTQFIQFSLASFVIDRRWDDLKALRDGKLVNVNFDAVKML